MIYNKTYSELITLDGLLNRYQYLKIGGEVGSETFGSHRHLNQMLYTSPKWKYTRRGIIIRDHARNLGLFEYEINGELIIIHHINPITIDDVLNDRDIIYDPENLITTTFNTHQAIHYGNASLLPILPEERRPNDTCPWKS